MENPLQATPIGQQAGIEGVVGLAAVDKDRQSEGRRQIELGPKKEIWRSRGGQPSEASRPISPTATAS
jgi:hypothetical protein